METSDLIFTISGTLAVLLCAFGALKQNRNNFLLGIVLFSLLPIIGEYMAYSATNNWGNLITMITFVGIAIVALPNKASYGADNLAATAIARKIGLMILVINLFQAYIILQVREDVAAHYGYMHVAIALLMIYVIIRSKTSSDFSWK